MIPINKEELIQQYIDYKVNYYRVNFKDMDRLDRVEKILNCHGWLPEAEETFKPIEEELKKKREILKERIIEALRNCEITTFFQLEERIKPLKEEIREIDRFGYTRIRATEELFKSQDFYFIDKATILMKLGEIGL